MPALVLVLVGILMIWIEKAFSVNTPSGLIKNGMMTETQKQFSG
jgi:hypothetical protein